MDSMLGFKQFIVEMAGEKRAFQTSANEAEGMLVRHIVLGWSRNPPKNIAKYIGNTETEKDDNRASRISNFIHETIKRNFDKNHSRESSESYDTGTSKKLAGETREQLGIPNFKAGRRIEDAVITSNNNHYLLDLKMSGKHSNGSFPSLKTNKIYSGISLSKDKNGKTIVKPRKNIVPNTHPVNQKDTLPVHINSLHKHFSSLDHNAKEKIVKELFNSHEETPKNVKKLQVIDGVGGTRIYDSDDVWNHFNEKFKPTSYSSEVSGLNKKIYAHNGAGEKMHISTVGVKHKRPSAGEQLDFNIRHHLSDKLSEKYGYKPLAYLEH